MFSEKIINRFNRLADISDRIYWEKITGITTWKNRLTCLNSLTLSSREGTVAQKAPGTYKEELNYLAQGEG